MINNIQSTQKIEYLSNQNITQTYAKKVYGNINDSMEPILSIRSRFQASFLGYPLTS